MAEESHYLNSIFMLKGPANTPEENENPKGFDGLYAGLRGNDPELRKPSVVALRVAVILAAAGALGGSMVCNRDTAQQTETTNSTHLVQD